MDAANTDGDGNENRNSNSNNENKGQSESNRQPPLAPDVLKEQRSELIKGLTIASSHITKAVKAAYEDRQNKSPKGCFVGLSGDPIADGMREVARVVIAKGIAFNKGKEILKFLKGKKKSTAYTTYGGYIEDQTEPAIVAPLLQDIFRQRVLLNMKEVGLSAKASTTNESSRLTLVSTIGSEEFDIHT